MELNEKIMSFRKQKGLSQQEVAEALDVSRQAVSRWEVGASLPSMENLLALSKLFGISIGELTSAGEPLDVPEHGGEESQERKKASRLKGRKWLLGVVLAVVVIGGVLIATYSNQDKMKPADQNIVEFEELEEERISDSDAVENLPTS